MQTHQKEAQRILVKSCHYPLELFTRNNQVSDGSQIIYTHGGLSYFLG